MKEIFEKNVKSGLKAFTLLVKHFRENPLFAKLTHTLTRFSQTKFRSVAAHSYGFTLAELITVVVLLGIVAAVTIPSTIKKHTETIKRTKIKKALETYNAVIQKMVVEHRFKTTQALDDWAAGPNGTCGNAKAYFNIAQTSGNCMFKTHDGIWWYIDSGNDKYDRYSTGDKLGRKKVSMSAAIVSFELETKQEKSWRNNGKLNQSIQYLLIAKASRADWSDAFYFVTTFDNKGAPRVMDLQYGLNSVNLLNISPPLKVYNFINTQDEDYLPITEDCATEQKNCCKLHNHNQEKVCYNSKGQYILLTNISNGKNGCSKDFYNTNSETKIKTFRTCGGMTKGGVNYNPCISVPDGGLCKNNEPGITFPYIHNIGEGNYMKYHSQYSPQCANTLGDECYKGTYSLSTREETLNWFVNNNKDALYSETMKNILNKIGGDGTAESIGTEDGFNVSSVSTSYFGYVDETGSYTKYWGEGYLYQSGQTTYKFKKGDKEISFTIRPDGYVYYTNPDKSVGGNMKCKYPNLDSCSVCHVTAEHIDKCQ